MDTAEQKRLSYRRQYIIAPESVDSPFEANTFSLNEHYSLYAHVDLLVTVAHEGNDSIVLLGDLFDYESPEKTNSNILNDLLVLDHEHFLERISVYSGRHVLIFLKQGRLNIVTDATSTRKVFYFRGEKGIWMGSQSHLLARVCGLEKTKDALKLKFYQSEEFKNMDNANIGSTTYYDEISQLMPNHYMDIDQFGVHRFWPNKEIKIRPFNEVAEECAAMIKGFMEAIVHRYEVMLPVTAGNDSRMLLGGVKDVREELYYYINRNDGLLDSDPDIRIPAKLLKELDMKFHVLELDTEIDEDFKKVFFENNPLASEKYLPHIYNYYINFSEKVNLPGIYAAAPLGLESLSEKNITPANLVNLYTKLDVYDHATSYYTEWLEDVRPLCSEFNIDIIRLLYWEERVGNWGSQTQLDKDIAQEDINPLNSRMLVEKFYSVERKYNMRSTKLINKKIIEVLWPELLSVSFNPGLKTTIIYWLTKLNLLKSLARLKYKIAR